MVSNFVGEYKTSFRKSCSVLNDFEVNHKNVAEQKVSSHKTCISASPSLWENAYKSNPDDFIKRRDKAFDWLNDTIGALALDTPSGMTWPKVQNSSGVESQFSSNTNVKQTWPSGFALDLATSVPAQTKKGPSLNQLNQIPHHNWPTQTGPQQAVVTTFPALPPPLPQNPPNFKQQSTMLTPLQPQNGMKPSGYSEMKLTPTQVHPAQFRSAPSAPQYEFATNTDYYQDALQLQKTITGATLSQCWLALRQTSGDARWAECIVKIDMLFMLGLSSRENCHKVLISANWSLERAASILLDTGNLKVS